MDNTTNTIEVLGRTYTYTDGQFFKDGKLYRRAIAGDFEDNTKVYRRMGNYNLYVWSFADAALPYSRYFIADTKTGRVYTAEVLHGIGDERRYIKEMVEFFKERETI